jgi:hypothetical protein
VSVIGVHMAREMGRLRAKWNPILEIATRDSENQQRLKRERELEQDSKTIGELRELSVLGQRPGLQSPMTQSGYSRARLEAPSFTWRELEERFQEVKAKTSPRHNVYALFTRTEWSSGPVEEEWTVGGYLALQKQFESLGSIAAQKLGYAASDSAYKNWLAHLRDWMKQTGLDKDSNLAWRPSGSFIENGSNGTTQNLYLESVVELSAKFCLGLLAYGATRARRTKAQLNKTRAIFGAIQSGLKGPKYCAALDARKVNLPEQWKEDGCPDTYVKAYREPLWRQRIQDEKSRHREQYDKTSAREREATIQGETGTRLTRR